MPAALTAVGDTIAEETMEYNWEEVQKQLGVDITFDEYLHAEDNLEASEPLTDTQIVKIVQGKADERESKGKKTMNKRVMKMWKRYLQ